MRIRMLEVAAMPEPALLLEFGLDRGIRLEHLEPADDRQLLAEAAVHADWRVDLEPVPHARREVVGPVAGRRVYRAGALIERDVFGQDAGRVAVVERMPEGGALER